MNWLINFVGCSLPIAGGNYMVIKISQDQN
uniref:Uncharacterized protein n=1 Tax=Anguilla anguilla TaxID=7936 RepID=A0A0E9V638_ANGAN